MRGGKVAVLILNKVQMLDQKSRRRGRSVRRQRTSPALASIWRPFGVRGGRRRPSRPFGLVKVDCSIALIDKCPAANQKCHMAVAQQAPPPDRTIGNFYQSSLGPCFFRSPCVNWKAKSPGFSSSETMELARRRRYRSRNCSKSSNSYWRWPGSGILAAPLKYAANAADPVGRCKTARRSVRRPAGQPRFPVPGVHGRG